MKPTLHLIVLSLCLGTASLLAGTESHYSSTDSTNTGESATSSFPFEFDAEYAHIGEGDVSRSFREVNNFDENYSLVRFIYTPRIKFGILRLGAAWERYEFDLPSVSRLRIAPGLPGGFLLGSPQLPDTLQSVSAVVGLDTQFSDSILFRIEAEPGYYGTDDLDGDTFNVPFLLGGTYIYSSNLQFVFGVGVDFNRNWPAIPGGGIRWRLSDKWLLNAVVPTPRLEFQTSKSLTIYAGANLKGSTYRVDNDFGNTRADTRLNHAVLSYTEIRTGLGVEWKVTPEIKFSVEGGYLPYRQFDYHRADIRYRYESGAPYGAISLNAAF
jgi:hypothetical protein